MACKEKKNTLWVYIIKQTGETLPTVSANKDCIIPELSRHPRPTSEKKKRKEKKHPFFQKKGKCLPCMLQCLSLCWNGISRVNLVLELKSKLRWQQQNYTGITASHELSLCSCVPNLPSNHRWYCHEGPQAVDK